jgi:uncharacterized lipoprotein YddW (UPF0748 family)
MGKLASPLFSYIKQQIQNIPQLAFVSLAGGALGKNKDIEKQLTALGEGKTKAVAQFYINDLLSEEKKGKMEATSDYRIDPETLQEAFGPQLEEFVNKIRN